MYKIGFVAPWILNSNLKYKRCTFLADFGLENFLLSWERDMACPQIPGATLKSGLEFLEWDRRCQREVGRSRGKKVSKGVT